MAGTRHSKGAEATLLFHPCRRFWMTDVQMNATKLIVLGQLMMIMNHNERSEGRGDLYNPTFHLTIGSLRFPKVQTWHTMRKEVIDNGCLTIEKLRSGNNNQIHFLPFLHRLDEVKRCIPVFPDRLTSHFLQSLIDDLCGSIVRDSELLQSLGISVIATRIHMRLCRHRGNSERAHVISNQGWLTSGIGNVHIMVEDAHGKSGLSQLPVCHNAVGLKTLVLSRSHTREVNRILRAPVMLLQVAQMASHHHHICTPLLFQSYQHPHTNRVNTSLPHAVKSVTAPFKVALHTPWMVDPIVLSVVSLLKTDNTIQSMESQFVIVFSPQRHDLNLDV